MALNIMKQIYEKVTVFGQPMLFTGCRVERATLPKGLFLYEVRHDEERLDNPCQIGRWIWVNYLGTLITNKPIRLEPAKRIDNAYRDIDLEKDWKQEGGQCTLREYMESYPPKKEQQQEHAR